MNFFDRLAAAITPEASDEDRAQARREAEALAQDDWLARVLEQHQLIETLFIEARMAEPGADRVKAMKHLGQLLTAHSMAEEVVLYQAIARLGDKGDATMAYEEQSMAKVEMAALERLDPESDAWLDQLETIRKAVALHVYEEESDWFPKLHRAASETEADMLSLRYDEEFDRHGDLGAGHSHTMPARQEGPSTGGYTSN